jgi:hypothetical protein
LIIKVLDTDILFSMWCSPASNERAAPARVPWKAGGRRLALRGPPLSGENGRNETLQRTLINPPGTEVFYRDFHFSAAVRVGDTP